MAPPTPWFCVWRRTFTRRSLQFFSIFSPHLTYFTPRTLLHLAGAHGFHEHTHNTLQAIEARGLWARIRCDRTKSWAYSAASWLAIMGALPLLALQPSDITVQIFGKTGKLKGS